MLEYFIKIQLPSSVNSILNDVEKIKSIFFIDQSIGKDSEDFMRP